MLPEFTLCRRQRPERFGPVVDPWRARRLAAAYQGSRGFLEPILQDAGLPVELVSALDDTTLDGVLRTETDEALTLTGKDVGAPILHFRPPSGVAFSGPVISRLPRPRRQFSSGTT
jgi:hypothetical protein